MKIDTDVIKNKEFKKAIEPSLLKHSQEYKVLATLRYLFPHKFETMVTDEAPDLQDKTNGIGIEVTVAVKENDMKASRAFANFRQKNSKDVGKNKKIIESNGYSFTPVQGNKVAIGTSGTSNGEKIFFQESIRKKTKKLRRYRANFKEIGLAVILPEIPTVDAENHFCEWISEVVNESDHSFDFVYMLSHRSCIYYGVRESVSEKWSFTVEENKLLSTIARMTAEGELSLNDAEWQ